MMIAGLKIHRRDTLDKVQCAYVVKYQEYFLRVPMPCHTFVILYFKF